jgi:hypothetical protein
MTMLRRLPTPRYDESREGRSSVRVDDMPFRSWTPTLAHYVR